MILLKSNAKINSTLKNTEQKEQQTTNMESILLSSKQYLRTRKGTVKKSSWAGRTIKIKSRAKGEL